MIQIRRFPLALTIITTLILGSAAETRGCPVAPTKSQDISVTMSSGVTTLVSINFYEGTEGGDPSGSCTAYANLRLSSFPSSRVATRPGELASALREIAEEWSVHECTIFVSYDNDTRDEFAEHELCKTETFEFKKTNVWSSSSEKNCWDPS